MNRIPRLASACLLAAACSPLAQADPSVSVGVGFIHAGNQTVKQDGKPDRDLQVYKNGPVLELAVNLGDTSWVGGRVRGTAFFLPKGDAKLQDANDVNAESYGLTAVLDRKRF